MFSGFLWPNTIKHISVTPGQTNQVFGHWEPEIEAGAVTIDGLVQTINLKELQKLDSAIFSYGDRKLTVLKTVAMKEGDAVQIYEDAAGTNITKWWVRGKSDAPNAGFASLELDFETFLLSRAVD